MQVLAKAFSTLVRAAPAHAPRRLSPVPGCQTTLRTIFAFLPKKPVQPSPTQHHTTTQTQSQRCLDPVQDLFSCPLDTRLRRFVLYLQKASCPAVIGRNRPQPPQPRLCLLSQHISSAKQTTDSGPPAPHFQAYDIAFRLLAVTLASSLQTATSNHRNHG